MFTTLLKKELLEQRRTSRLLVMVAVFFIVGLISPLLAKYTPVLLQAIPDLPAEIAAAIPEPTVVDSITQYLKNTSQFGVLLAIILTMGVLAQEKERGTAAMLLTKPVKRTGFVLAKWLSGTLVLFLGIVISAAACALYTLILFEPLPFGAFIYLNLLMLVYLSVYMTLALLASALVRTQSMAAAASFGGLILLLILGALPVINDYLPGALLEWGGGLMFGDVEPAWGALIVSLGLVAVMLVLACLKIEKEEI